MPYFAHGEPVTVYKPTVSTDRYGNEVSTWAADATYERCVVSSRTSDNSTDITDRGRQGVIVGLKVFLPVGAQVGNYDRLEVRGKVYEILGEPFAPHSPFSGLEPGVSVALRRVEG